MAERIDTVARELPEGTVTVLFTDVAGEILVSDVLRGMARSLAGVDFEDHGEQEMKGVGEPVRLYEVRWRDA